MEKVLVFGRWLQKATQVMDVKAATSFHQVAEMDSIPSQCDKSITMDDFQDFLFGHITPDAILVLNFREEEDRRFEPSRSESLLRLTRRVLQIKTKTSRP